MLLGTYLFVTPWAFGTSGHAASSENAWVAGVCLVVAALPVPVASGRRAATVIRVGVGARLMDSPFVLGFAGSWAAWNARIVGALTIAFADVPRMAFLEP